MTTSAFAAPELTSGSECPHLNRSVSAASLPAIKAGTHPVGLKATNAWGLHDMLGNVCEWCADTWYDSYDGAPTDGSARIETGGVADRVIRGGSWGDIARFVRAAYRGHFDPTYRDGSFGFRCARV